MQEYLLLLLALIAGVIIAIYLPMNGLIGKLTGSPIIASIVFFLGALLTSIAILVAFGNIKDLTTIIKMPPYLLVTGIAGALMILLTTLLIPRIGARKMFLLLLSGQVIMAIIVSHFGLFDSPKDPITIKKIIGAATLIIGAIISLV